MADEIVRKTGVAYHSSLEQRNKGNDEGIW